MISQGSFVFSPYESFLRKMIVRVYPKEIGEQPDQQLIFTINDLTGVCFMIRASQKTRTTGGIVASLQRRGDEAPIAFFQLFDIRCSSVVNRVTFLVKVSL